MSIMLSSDSTESNAAPSLPLLSTYDTNQGAIRAVRYSADGNYLVTAGSDKTIKLSNPTSRTLIQTYIGHGAEVTDLTCSHDNANMCSASIDKTVNQWDIKEAKILRRFRGHAGKINSVTYNRDSSLIVSGSLDGTVRIWDCRSKAITPIQVLDDARDSITSVTCPKSTLRAGATDHLILTTSLDGCFRFYDLRKGQLQCDDLSPHGLLLSATTADAQCSLLACCSPSRLVLLDHATGYILNEYSTDKPIDCEYRLECGIDFKDRLVFSGSKDGKLYAWNLTTARLQACCVVSAYGPGFDTPGRESLYQPPSRPDSVAPVIYTLAPHPNQAKLATCARSCVSIFDSSKLDAA